jgi:transcriptional regulator with XRE-family HTH domain
MPDLATDKLKLLRQAKALSQGALAARCGLSRKTVQRLETGQDVQPETLALVAAALGVAVDEIAEAGGRRELGDPRRLGLRRVRSGRLVFEQMARTDVGRLECDADVDSRSIEPLTRLVILLQGLMRESWDVARPALQALSLVERLRTIAALNDELQLIEAAGLGLYMGHYYRYPAPPPGAPSAAPESPPPPVVLTRLSVADNARERVEVLIDSEWRGAPEAVAASPDDLFTPAGEAMVFLYPERPLSAVDAAPEGYLEGVYQVVPNAS